MHYGVATFSQRLRSSTIEADFTLSVVNIQE